jgi:hypothetical protein
MSKVWSKVAIDYSVGVILGEDGQVHPKKIGCYVDDLKTAQEFAKKWKS